MAERISNSEAIMAAEYTVPRMMSPVAFAAELVLSSLNKKPSSRLQKVADSGLTSQFETAARQPERYVSLWRLEAAQGNRPLATPNARSFRVGWQAN